MKPKCPACHTRDMVRPQFNANEAASSYVCENCNNRFATAVMPKGITHPITDLHHIILSVN